MSPSVDQYEPVATTTISAPYSATSFAASRRVRDELDVLELVDLDLPVVDDAGPFTQARQLRDPPHRAAHVVLRLDEMHAAHAALAEDHRALHAGRPGADDEHVVVGVRRFREPLRMPAAAVLLARSRVLRADQRRPADLPARDADVAADALADIVEPSLVDLLRQERVGRRRPAGGDDVELALVDRLGHQVRVRPAADPEHRLLGHRLDGGLPREARGPADRSATASRPRPTRRCRRG